MQTYVTEKVTLTLIPKSDLPDFNTKPDKVTARRIHKIEKDLTNFWEKLCSSYLSTKLFEQQVTNGSSDDDNDDAANKVSEPPDYTRTTEAWLNYHADLLTVSSNIRRFVYQLDVEHLETGVKFRRYYCDGKSQICESLTETFNKNLLI